MKLYEEVILKLKEHDLNRNYKKDLFSITFEIVPVYHNGYDNIRRAKIQLIGNPTPLLTISNLGELKNLSSCSYYTNRPEYDNKKKFSIYLGNDKIIDNSVEIITYENINSTQQIITSDTITYSINDFTSEEELFQASTLYHIDNQYLNLIKKVQKELYDKGYVGYSITGNLETLELLYNLE